VNETLFVDGDTDMQFLVREPHEDEVARLKLVPGNRHSAGELLVRGARHAEAGAAGRVRDQTAAVESAGRGATPVIRLAKHGHGAINHDRSWIRRCWVPDDGRCSGCGGWHLRVAGLERMTRARGQSQAQACGQCRPN
jgi:hypothetical protein